MLAFSYPFPPAAVVGVYRIVKYCKYLPSLGWEPVVVTVPFPDSPHRDDQLATEIPAIVRVLRTWDPNVDTALMKTARWMQSQRRTTAPTPGAQAARREAASAPGWLSRVKASFRRLLLESPDAQLFWVPFAILRGAVELITSQIDVIYSTSPPHSSHLTAFVLGKIFRKPYVLDFRDPWEFVSGPQRRLLRWVKRLVVFHAAKVVTVSQGEREELLQEFPGLNPERVEVITNGYDPDDFVDVQQLERDTTKIRLSHVGMIHRDAGGEFFDALTILAGEVPGLEKWLSVTLVGGFDPEYQGVIDELERCGIVTRAGFVPKRVALRHVISSDALVILLGGDRFAPSELPAKLSEYLYSGKPIVAVAKRGELWDVLTRSGAGVAVPPHEPKRLAQTILQLCQDIRSQRNTNQVDREYIARFDRRVLTSRFAAILNQVAGTPNAI